MWKRLNFPNFRVSEKDIAKEIKKLSTKKAVQNTDIPLKIIKESANIFGSYLCETFNECIEGIFPDILKYVYITIVFKKGTGGLKKTTTH